MPSYKRPWLAVTTLASLLQICLCLKLGRLELTAGLGISWFVFFLLAADLRDLPAARPTSPWFIRALAGLAAVSACAMLLIASRLLALRGNPDASLHTGAGQVFRFFPIVFAGAMLLLRGSRDDLPAQLFTASTLLCPIVSPVPDWIRDRIEVGALSAWGAQRILPVLGLHAGRRGPLLDLPSGDHLLVNSQCSGLGSMMQLVAIGYLLWLVLDARAIRLAALVPICLALGLAVNCARVAWLSDLLNQHQKIRFDFWHEQSGSLIYQAIATALLLLIAFPLLSRRSSTSSQAPG